MVSQNYGSVQKCPQCGNPVEPLAMQCSACGHVFRNAPALMSSQVLYKKLEDIDMAYRNSGNEKRRIQERASAIMNFPVPTTKEDLLDFAASMRARKTQCFDEDEEYYAYASKYEECLTKVKMFFPNDPQAHCLIAMDKEDVEKQKQEDKKSTRGFILYFVILIIMIILGIIAQPFLK